MIKKIQLPPDTLFRIQFKRMDIDQIYGPALEFKTIKNDNPPVKPSKPIVTAGPGQFDIEWDGKSAGGTAYLPDFNRVEVHVSDTDNFVPTTDTKTDQISRAGDRQYAQSGPLKYSTTYYVRFVAYNNSGIASEPSDISSGTYRRLSGIDLEDGSINVDKINLSFRELGGNLDYYQPTAPSATANPKNLPMFNDRWFDSDDGYKFYRYFDPTLSQGTGAGVPSDESYTAYAIRQNKSNNRQWLEIPLGNQVPGARIFWQPTAPVQSDYPGGFKQGDTWYDNDADNRLYIWVPGTGWQGQQFGSSAIAAGAITAGKIAAGQVTADKMAANSITAQNAAIANAAIDDAKIANVSANKLSAGTISANIIISGNIRTAESGSRVELGPSGLFLYNSANAATAFFSTQTGLGYLTGEVVSTRFRTNGFQTGGYGYIEIGDTGPNDPTDEIRMFYGGTVASLRNPSSNPGNLIMSFQSGRILTFSGSYMYVPTDYFWGSQAAQTGYAISGYELRLQFGDNFSSLFMKGTDGGNKNIMMGNFNGGGAIKFLAYENKVQIRNIYDNGYADLVANNIQATGSMSVNGSFSPSSVSTSYVYSSGSIYAQGGFTSQSMSYFNAGLRTDQGSIYARYTSYIDDQLYVTNNVTSYNGGFYGRGFYNNSDPTQKVNIRELDIDAIDLLSTPKIHAWNWPATDKSPEVPGIGLLTSEVPYIATPEAGQSNGEGYDLATMVALLTRMGQQLVERNTELEKRVAVLEATLDAK